MNRHETTPESSKYAKEHESSEKPPRVPKSQRNKSFQSLNYTFVEDPCKKGKEYIGPVSNIAKSCKHTLIKEILSYASTPPRPILSSESNQPIIYEVSGKGSEFHVLTSFLAQFNRTLARATKCFNHDLILALPKMGSLGFLSNSINSNRTRVLFLTGAQEMLRALCFDGVRVLDGLDVVLYNSILGFREELRTGFENFAVICLVSRENLIKINSGAYSVMRGADVVPAYLVCFT